MTQIYSLDPYYINYFGLFVDDSASDGAQPTSPIIPFQFQDPFFNPGATYTLKKFLSFQKILCLTHNSMRTLQIWIFQVKTLILFLTVGWLLSTDMGDGSGTETSVDVLYPYWVGLYSYKVNDTYSYPGNTIMSKSAKSQRITTG